MAPCTWECKVLLAICGISEPCKNFIHIVSAAGGCLEAFSWSLSRTSALICAAAALPERLLLSAHDNSQCRPANPQGDTCLGWKQSSMSRICFWKHGVLQEQGHRQNAMKAGGPRDAMPLAQQERVWTLLTAGSVDLRSLQLTSSCTGASSQQSGPPVLLACSHICSTGDSSHAAILTGRPQKTPRGHLQVSLQVCVAMPGQEQVSQLCVAWMRCPSDPVQCLVADVRLRSLHVICLLS